MKYERMILAGSTGSIGKQTIEVAKHCGIRIEAISSRGNHPDLIEEQIRLLHPRFCYVKNRSAASLVKKNTRDTDTIVLTGKNGMEEMISSCSSKIVLNAVVGNEGLETSVLCLKYKKDLALANKETLVIGGELFMDGAKNSGVRIYPVDSEHCAVSQCIGKEKADTVEKIILTASGGPFFGLDRRRLKNVTPEETLRHPTWSMGKRITVDSATLMNKGFELIEAVHLFGLPPERIDVVIHRESVLHSAVQFIDKTVIGQMSVPDMRSCIQYALTANKRVPSLLSPLDLASLGKMTFFEPDHALFPSIGLAKSALKRGGVIPAVLNKADEMAVELFLQKKIAFTEIAELIEKVLRSFPDAPLLKFTDIQAAEKKTEKMINDLFNLSK